MRTWQFPVIVQNALHGLSHEIFSTTLEIGFRSNIILVYRSGS